MKNYLRYNPQIFVILTISISITFGPFNIIQAGSQNSPDPFNTSVIDIGSRLEFEGSKANNIIIKPDSWDVDFTHVFVPFKDNNPNCLPEQRYKAIARKGQRGNALTAFVSEDGIRWKTLPRYSATKLNRP